MNGKPHIQLCKNVLSGNQCDFQVAGQCSFCHSIQMHKEIVNSDPDLTSKNNSGEGFQRGRHNGSSGGKSNNFSSTDVALWTEPTGILKIFASSEDGHWRLYNTSTGFNKEVQHNMGGKVNKVMVESNFLFCGFEGTCIKIPNVRVGMIHAWNLGNPGDPPMEMHMHETAPFAHGGRVTSFITNDDMCFSGGMDDVIRIWKYESSISAGKGGFKMMKECCGHASEITGLLMVGQMLWSCSVDRTIRLWDSKTNWECKYFITENTLGSATTLVPPSPQTGSGVGHKDAITGIIAFDSQAGNFVLTCSLDGHVKVWNSTNGECLSSTDHGVGIICMALSADTKGNAILIVGAIDGRILFRSLLQTPKTPPMCFLCSIDGNFTRSGHVDNLPIKSIASGPSGTFYTVGEDGKLCVWQVVGDLGLN